MQKLKCTSYWDFLRDGRIQKYPPGSRRRGINAKLFSRTSVSVSPETPLDYNPTEFRADRSKDGRVMTEIPTTSGAESRLFPW